MRIKYNATSCYNYIMKIWEDTIIKITEIQLELAVTQHNKKLNNSCFATNPSSIYIYIYIYIYIHNFYCPQYMVTSSSCYILTYGVNIEPIRLHLIVLYS